jgi:hypothetical protein
MFLLLYYVVTICFRSGRNKLPVFDAAVLRTCHWSPRWCDVPTLLAVDNAYW